MGYEMLNGLQTGDNFTWGASLQRNIGAGVQLNMSYEGRKSSNVNVVHTGNMQVRAYF
jgi:long-subunit fatty acid transport protein